MSEPQPETVREQIVIDRDPRRRNSLKDDPVVATIEVPPKATSSGWGDMSWTR
ncbi:hypothetical protein [Nocardioides sp. MH1]|uniref:hypothetical protein n=1 Tax=Nocardioides sp. MH1 TaxID=3242490 RepID=UPI0035230A03